MAYTDRHPIDALLLCYDDNANTMHRFSCCLKHLGLNVVALKGKYHPFGYPVQSPVIYPLNAPLLRPMGPTTIMGPGLESLMAASRVIHFFHSTYVMTSTNLDKKKVVVQHGGTAYRQFAQACNDFFNQFADATIFQCPDLLGMGAKNEHLIYYPVDTTFFKYVHQRRGQDGKLIVGHFPSNPSMKGTNEILMVLDELIRDPEFKDKLALNINLKPRPWLENVKAQSRCDVVIETLMATQDGKPYGEWGNTALECSAQGTIVITNHTQAARYQSEYGVHAKVMVANGPKDLKVQLMALANAGDDHLRAIRAQQRQWAEDFHSIPATAKRLWDLVYKPLFEGD